MKRYLVITALFCLIFSVLGIVGCTAPSKQPTSENKLTVTFIIDEESVMTQTVSKGELISSLDYAKEGYVLNGWYTDKDFDTKWDFENDKLQSDLSIYAFWQIIDYTVTFIADGKTVEVQHFNIENKTITEPAVPDKDHYTAKWEEYKIDLSNIEVNAIYTPVEYTISYFADNDLVKQLKYTVDTKAIIPPAVPEKAGYKGSWEQKQLEYGDITINAEYTLITYKATFMSDDRTIAVEKFSVEDMIIEVPIATLPEKTGYEAQWERYELSLADITINAIYVPVIYTAEFFVDNEKLASVPFTIEDNALQEPEITEKTGYTAKWESYEIKAADIKINAEFSTIIYYATFVCDGQEIEKVAFTVENMQIIEPTPTYKENYSATWEAYTLTCNDITINAVYIKNEFTYKSLPDGTLTVTGYTGSDLSPVIPFEHNGIKITQIAEGAFAFTKFEQLTIPNNIVEIGERAFAHSEIKSIKLSGSVSKIIDNVFYYCEQLESIELGNNLKTFCTNAFVNCTALKNITIPSSVTEIQTQAFADCTNLTEIIFEDTAGWEIYTEDGTFIRELDSEDLKDKSTAADYVTRIFWGRCFKKQ